MYCGLLTINSPVFELMLDTSSAEDQETYEGYPLVHLEDSSEDIGALLKALYRRRFFVKGTCTPFDRLTSLARLSSKYNIKHLMEDVAAHLSLIYPSSLEDYWKRDKSLFADFRPHAVEALDMSHDLPALLPIAPVAFYDCCELTAAEIVDGVTHAGEEYGISSDRDVKTCLVGRDALIKAKHARVDNFLMSLSPAQPCRTTDRCCRALALYLRDHRDRGLLDKCDIFSRQPLWAYYSAHTTRLCAVCHAQFRDSENNALDAVWKELPTFFDLESWEKLQERQKTALECRNEDEDEAN
ncbi:hypothetical protein OE88DRAFT_1486272 [Heliocybe sulcata]|uniref:BTB domain-containing protein n=1 Tax=Heliocybe sulcata TaxID=5364 RepID=A0A5C3N497_9AGAM|nr:hypothetical protein OE88DRAFT_1486272 [Heliocybe sulcata]